MSRAVTQEVRIGQPQLLYAGEHLEVAFQDRPADRLLITFNEIGMRANGRSIWGGQLADKLGMPILGFTTRRPNWFPGEEMQRAVDSVLPIVRRQYSIKIAFGHSQGAYAALKWGQALQADRILAFCPQWSIDPGDIIDSRFNRYFDSELNRGMAIGSESVERGSWVFFDPAEKLDVAQINAISSRLPVALVRVPSSGHSTIRAFASSALMQRVFEAAERIDLRAMEAVVRDARRFNPLRALNLSIAVGQRKPRLATAVFRAHQNSIPLRHWPALFERIVRGGGVAYISGFLDELAARMPPHPASWSRLGLAYQADSRPEDARKAFQRAIELAPQEPRFRLLLDRLNRLSA